LLNVLLCSATNNRRLHDAKATNNEVQGCYCL
jgi:hypothetical protein